MSSNLYVVILFSNMSNMFFLSLLKMCASAHACVGKITVVLQHSRETEFPFLTVIFSSVRLAQVICEIRM